MCVDIAARWWSSTVHPNGRRGQGQHGVDLYALRLDGAVIGGQSKNVKALTIADVQREIAEAESFKPALTEYWIFTSLDVDARLQEEIRLLSLQRQSRGAFSVGIRFWQEIAGELCTPREDGADLLMKYYKGWVQPTVPVVNSGTSLAVTQPTMPPVDWRTFQVVPDGEFPASQVYLKLYAIPNRPRSLVVDGELFSEFRDQVVEHYGVVDPDGPPWKPRIDAVELLWRKPPDVRGDGTRVPALALHWMRGCDGSVGFATTLESRFSPGRVSLMEVALDCLSFIRFARALVAENLTLHLDFQPWKLTAVPGGLAREHEARGPLRNMRLSMPGPDPSTAATIGDVSESFTKADLAIPFPLLAGMLVHRWRRIYNLHGLSAKPLSEDLAQLATNVLHWAPPPPAA